MDNRGVSPVVGKLLEVGLLTLYIGLLATTLYGGVVPGYERAAGEEMAERTVAAAAHRVEAAVPETGVRVRARHSVSLPATIAGAGYEIRTDGHSLVLDHPHRGITARATLSLPSGVTRLSGVWQSGAETVVVVRGSADGFVIRLAQEGEG